MNHFDQYNMKLSQFKFRLPEELIAQYPSPYREDARLMVLHRKSGEIEHKLVRDMVPFVFFCRFHLIIPIAYGNY